MPNDRHQLFVDVIRDFTKEHGISPTYREIAEITGKSRTTVERVIADLMAAGVITRRLGAARSIQVRV